MSSETNNLILIKRSTTSGTIPDLSALALGELALNTSDGNIFLAKTEVVGTSSVVTFLNSDQQPFISVDSLSSVNTQYGGNTVTQVFAGVLGGYNNDVSGGGSTVINGEDNDIAGDFSLIGSGLNNKILASGDYSAILGGTNNLISHQNSFAIGSNLSSNEANFTYVNNISAMGYLYGDGSHLTGVIAAGIVGADTEVRDLTAYWDSTYTTVLSESASWIGSSDYLPLSGGTLTGTIVGNVSATGSFYGDGSNLTGIVAGDSEATTLVRTNSANWESVYTSYNTNSASIDASYITSGILDANRLPAFDGDITTSVSNGSLSATVVAIRGEPISTQTPLSGQVLQWTGNSWTPGTIPTGGSGGGGVTYYFNFGTQAQAPTTNLPTTPNTPKELGIVGLVAGSSYTSGNVSTTNYDLVCGFVSLTSVPNTTTIPAGLWDFNIWASSTATITNQMIMRLFVYKYDGSNPPTLLAQSDDISLYDPSVAAQYIASIVFPQTTISITDRIYIEIRAKGTQNGKTVTVYFGGATPSHAHTTLPSIGGSGLVKVIDGVYQTPASLLVDSDVASNAEIDQTKINGLTDVSSKANSTYTTVQTNSSLNWDNSLVTSYVNNTFLPIAGGTLTGNLSVLGDLVYVDTSVAVVSTMYIDTNTILDPALRITQRGTGDVIRVEDSTNPDSTPFIINSDGLVGVGISSPNEKLTIVGNVSATGSFYGDGSNLTGIVAGDSEATTLVRTNSANWESTYTTVRSNSASWQTTFAASSAYVSSNPTGITGASALTKLLQITQAGYNSITPDSDTLYIIVG